MFVPQALGLKRTEVVVVPYDPRWPLLFQETSAQLRAALGPSILGVHHVGSTAVPGLCAKPILDVLVSVPHFADAKRLVTPLAVTSRLASSKWGTETRTSRMGLAHKPGTAVLP